MPGTAKARPTARPRATPRARSRVLPRNLPNLSARAFQHPADRAALTALKSIPAFDLALRKLLGALGDRSLRLAFLASAVRVTRGQLPRVHDRYREACRVLDIRPAPELFVAQTPFVNAGALGLDTPFLVLHSATIDLLDEDELQFLLGHELGHVLSGHGLYKTLLHVLLRLGMLAGVVPLGGAARLALTAALLEWDRKSELSADRAGLLAVQDLEVARRVHMKMAGGSRTAEMSLPEFERQAEEYTEGGDVVDSVMKLLRLLGQTHPFPVLRLVELGRWVDSGGYDRILDGDYPRRQDDGKASVAEDVKESAAAYREAWEGGGRLPRFVSEVARDVVAAGGSLADRLRQGRQSREEAEKKRTSASGRPRKPADR